MTVRKINPSQNIIETNISDTNIHNDIETNVLSYKFVHLNVNGWTSRNSKLRQKILLSSDADFISINETHERYEGLISLPGYVWFGAKRIKQHIKSVRAFGGVGMFVKEHISKEFFIKIIDKSYDGIMVVEFIHKHSKFKLISITAYLPPEHSKWG